MFGRATIFLAILGSTLAMPTAAQTPAPTTTAFDGTYTGVSKTLDSTITGGSSRSCTNNPRPGPLTIVNGIATWAGDTTGSVSPQGVLAMHAPNGARLDGQIDAQGTVTGRFIGACSYQLVWHKKAT
jgi:hypothetical protein